MNLRKPKDTYSKQEKQLCETQAGIVAAHVNSCPICKKSFESQNNRIGIVTSPPCKTFLSELRSHVDKCQTCKIANQKWNFDAVPVDDEMRSVALKLTKLFSKF